MGVKQRLSVKKTKNQNQMSPMSRTTAARPRMLKTSVQNSIKNGYFESSWGARACSVIHDKSQYTTWNKAATAIVVHLQNRLVLVTL